MLEIIPSYRIEKGGAIVNVSSAFCAMSLNSVLYANRAGQPMGQSSRGVFGFRSPFQQDSLSISPQGRASGIVDALNKQKMQIEDRKNNLMAAAREDGRSMESIQAQLDSYDEQIKKIDEQITEATVQQMTASAEEQNRIVKKDDNQPKTEQEIQNEKMNNLMKLSSGLDRFSITNSVKTRVDGASAVLESEIALDKGRGSTASKEAELAELRQRSMNLTTQIGKQAANLFDQIQESNQPVDKVEETQESEEDPTAAEDAQKAGNSGADVLQAKVDQYVQAEKMPETQAAEVSQINALA